MSDTYEEIHVSIGQIRTGSGAQKLRANLGSCVGIGFLWPQMQRCALAHCLLPNGSELLEDSPAKYVNFVIPELFKAIGAVSEQRKQIDVIISGGGNMLSQAINGKTIGDLNVQSAMDELHKHRLVPIHCDTGGSFSRQIIIDCANYSHIIRRIEQ